MNQDQLNIQQQQHAEIIRQMKIDTFFNGVLAAASMITMITIVSKLLQKI